jgi:predicted  nucleic acid-binding Zn-ribbon protein
MHPELEKLVHLQNTEERVRALEAQLAAYPKAVQERQQALAAAERELAALAQSILAEDKQRRTWEDEADEQRRKAARHQAQMNTAQNQSQAQALEHEISFALQKASQAEDAALACMARIEALEEQQRNAQPVRTRLQERLAEEQAHVARAVARDQAERAELLTLCQQIRTTIEPQMLANYDRMSASRRPAVAEAIEQRCTACRMMVRPQKWNELQKNALVECDSCGRMLYATVAVDLSQDIALPRPAAS